MNIYDRISMQPVPYRYTLQEQVLYDSGLTASTHNRKFKQSWPPNILTDFKNLQINFLMDLH